MSDRYLVRNPRAAWRVYDAEAVVLSPDDSVLHTLNPAATIAWLAADGGTSWVELVSRVAGAFDVPSARIEADLRAFVDDVAARGLFIESEDPAAAEPGEVVPSDPGPLPAYEPPVVRSESVFETTALACGKLAGQGSKCNLKAKAS
jgi:hypothetical protein